MLNATQADGLLMLLARVRDDFTLLAHELQRCHEGVLMGTSLSLVSSLTRRTLINRPAAQQTHRAAEEMSAFNRRMSLEVASSLIKLSPSGSPVMHQPLQQQGQSQQPQPQCQQQPSAIVTAPPLVSQVPPPPSQKRPSPPPSLPSSTATEPAKRKRGPKPLDRSHLYCHMCNTRETPEWRSGPDGPRTLCNACGLNWRSHRLNNSPDLRSSAAGSPNRVRRSSDAMRDLAPSYNRSESSIAIPLANINTKHSANATAPAISSRLSLSTSSSPPRPSTIPSETPLVPVPVKLESAMKIHALLNS
jgi:hypothetical protein